MKRTACICLCLMLVLACLLPTCSLAEAVEKYGEATYDPAGALTLDEAGDPGDPATPSEPFIPDTTDMTDTTSSDKTSRANTKKQSKIPYDAIANMFVKARCGCKWTVSGFMISKNTLMTAAHSIVCMKHGKTAKGITMCFGYLSKNSYKWKYDGSTSYWFGTDFTNADGSHSYSYKAKSNDYAYIKLNKNIGKKTGWFGVCAMDDDKLKKAAIGLAGYRNGVLKFNTGSIDNVSDKLFTVSKNSEHISSGAPIFTSDSYVLGIYTAGGNAKKDFFCRRITDSLIKGLKDRELIDR